MLPRPRLSRPPPRPGRTWWPLSSTLKSHGEQGKTMVTCMLVATLLTRQYKNQSQNSGVPPSLWRGSNIFYFWWSNVFVQQEHHKHSGALEHAGDASKAEVEKVSTASLSRAGQEGQIQRIAGQQDHCLTWEPPSGVGGLRGQSGTWSSTCFLR